MLHTRQDETIANTSVFLDGERFVRCQFVDCTLIYEGREEVDFQDCTFEGCSWTFSDAAIRMLGFLATVHDGTGSTGPELVSGIFDSIRNKRLVTVLREEDETERPEATTTRVAS